MQLGFRHIPLQLNFFLTNLFLQKLLLIPYTIFKVYTTKQKAQVYFYLYNPLQ